MQTPNRVNDVESHAVVQAIGLDLGGSKLRGGTTTLDGALGPEILVATEAGSEDQVMTQVAQTIALLRDDRPEVVIALGVPGAIDPVSGRLSYSPNLPFSPDCRPGRTLEAVVGSRVLVENDVNLAALAETRLGAGRGLDLVCFLAFGTGVGLGLISGDRVLRGANGRAGEIGYLPLARDPMGAAAASAAGQFEDLVGSTAIQQRYGRDLPDVRTLFTRADGGDDAAAAAIVATARAAAPGLASLQTLLDPDLIVIGGGIGMRARFYDQLCADAGRLLPFPLAVARAALGPAAGMLGALVHACDAARLPAPRIGETALHAGAPAHKFVGDVL